MPTIRETVPAGSNQYPWRLPEVLVTAGVKVLATSDATLPAAGANAHLLAYPAASAVYHVIRGLEPTNSVLLKFFGTGASNDAFTGTIWGLRELRVAAATSSTPELLGDHLVDFTATLGTAAINTASRELPTALVIPIGTETGLWADTIAATDDSLTPPGARVFSDAADGSASMVIDASGYSGLLIAYKTGSDVTRCGCLFAEL